MLTRTFFTALLLLSTTLVKAQSLNELETLKDAQRWADSVQSTMSLDEQIGQLIMVAAYSNRDSTHLQELASLVTDYGVGGLIFFQGAPMAQSNMLNQLQHLSKVPLWVGMDAEWGHGMRLDSTMKFPHQLTLGAIRDDEAIYEMGLAIGRQFKRLGMHMNYAPVLDVNNNIENPVINFRSFGENRSNVATKGVAYIRGLQDEGIMAVGKHFPGHGDVTVDSHLDLPVIPHTRRRIDSLELFPFDAAIRSGVSGIMVGHLSVPVLDATSNLPTTLSKPTVTDVLRDSLQFDGMIMTDALNMGGITRHFEPGVIEAKALEAGNDLLLFPGDVPAAVSGIQAALRSGSLSARDIREKCRRVLVLKYQLGLSEPDFVDLEGLWEDLNGIEDSLLLRKLYRSALTVLKNDSSMLPLKRLDTLRIASLNIGTSNPDIWQERLGMYTEVDHFVLRHDRIAEDGPGLLEKLDQYNLLVLGVDSLSKWPGKNYGVGSDLPPFITALTSSIPTVLTWFNNPYGLSRLESTSGIKALIVGYQEEEVVRDFAAQLVFGGISANGRLPVSVRPEFPEGSGMDVEGELRLSYMWPEEAGLDRQVLELGLDSIANYALEEGVAPGIQVFVAKDQKVVYHSAFGYHTYDSLKSVVRDDLYDLASITKVTGALPALMRLHDQGKFSLDASLGMYLDDFEKGNKKDIPMRRILSHNARLEAWIPYWRTTLKKNGKFKRKTLSADSSEVYSIKLTDRLFLYQDYKANIYKQIRKSKLLPDAGYVYSGLSFYLYPEIVSSLTGEDFETHLASTFYRPLGAKTITYNPYKQFKLDRIIPTEVDTFFRKELIHGKVHDEGAAMMDGVSSNAGLFATANDLAKLMQMYMNMGTYGGERYISANTMEKFTFCHYCEEGNRRGLAFDKPVLENKENGSTAIDASPSSFGHSGYTGTFAWADPEAGILFIFLSNRVHPTRENRKLYELSIRPRMHQVVYDARIK